ncbi:uncharacterized protein LOC131935162 isoform X2 [Physella acuta]|uniref:uncharacterized protein LOC131935162 isoform X2 n=1 Tax=Physella acuta TaxID=109671 RepID=UPI0027DE5260|nr:uncharacterized protein LOC131935162 isoform X2 [Physella acuta]
MTQYIPPRLKFEPLFFNPIHHYQRGILVGENYPKVIKQNSQENLHFGHCKRREDTDMFEHPYFSPNYLQMPSNYSSGPSYWLDTRRTKDELSRWANDGIRHDRAFGEWHNVFGTRYFYGDTRRL